MRLGTGRDGCDVFVPFGSLLPMVSPSALVVSGWDISALPLVDAVERAQVLDVDLQRQLAPHLRAAYGSAPPLPSICKHRRESTPPPTHLPPSPQPKGNPSAPLADYEGFIAKNQRERANNLILGGGGSKSEHLAAIRAHIRDFKAQHALDTVVVLWSANTERCCEVRAGLNETPDELLAAIARSDAEVSPSTIFATAAVLEGAHFINGAPQNTFVPGLIALAARARPRVLLAGDDLKSGQTRLKSVLVDFLVAAGIKPLSIVSYNHLGNNDGKNLDEPAQFRSKELSKSSVIDDVVTSNGLLFPAGEVPDHVVVIKYVKAVGDSKRALDEYESKIFLGGRHTLVLHNTCEDSLLAAPLMLDLVVLTELFSRITVRRGGGEGEAEGEGEEAQDSLHPVLSLLSLFFKAPVVPPGATVVNALHRQREALVNFVRAAAGLAPDSHIDLEARLQRREAAGDGLEAPVALVVKQSKAALSEGGAAAPAGLGKFFMEQASTVAHGLGFGFGFGGGGGGGGGCGDDDGGCAGDVVR